MKPPRHAPRAQASIPLIEQLPTRGTMPSLTIFGILHHRDEATPVGQGTPLMPVEIQGGARTYRLTTPGVYDAMLHDRIVTFVCHKGQLDM